MLARTQLFFYRIKNWFINFLDPHTGGITGAMWGASRTSARALGILLERYKMARRVLLVYISWLVYDVLEFTKNMYINYKELDIGWVTIVTVLIGVLGTFVSFYCLARPKEESFLPPIIGSGDRGNPNTGV